MIEGKIITLVDNVESVDHQVESGQVKGTGLCYVGVETELSTINPLTRVLLIASFLFSLDLLFFGLVGFSIAIEFLCLGLLFFS